MDDNRAVFLCRGLPVESEAAAATAVAVVAVAAPPAPTLVVALARPAVTTASFSLAAPAPASQFSTPAASPAWSVEKRRVFMIGLAGWVYCLPPSG